MAKGGGGKVKRKEVKERMRHSLSPQVTPRGSSKIDSAQHVGGMNDKVEANHN